MARLAARLRSIRIHPAIVSKLAGLFRSRGRASSSWKTVLHRPSRPFLIFTDRTSSFSTEFPSQSPELNVSLNEGERRRVQNLIRSAAFGENSQFCEIPARGKKVEKHQRGIGNYCLTKSQLLCNDIVTMCLKLLRNYSATYIACSNVAANDRITAVVYQLTTYGKINAILQIANNFLQFAALQRGNVARNHEARIPGEAKFE